MGGGCGLPQWREGRGTACLVLVLAIGMHMGYRHGLRVGGGGFQINPRNGPTVGLQQQGVGAEFQKLSNLAGGDQVRSQHEPTREQGPVELVVGRGGGEPGEWLAEMASWLSV